MQLIKKTRDIDVLRFEITIFFQFLHRINDVLRDTGMPAK